MLIEKMLVIWFSELSWGEKFSKNALEKMGELTAEEEIKGRRRAGKMNLFGYELLTRSALAEKGVRENRDHQFISRWMRGA